MAQIKAEKFTLKGIIKRETELAILIDLDVSTHGDLTEDYPSGNSMWFPLSQVESIHRTHVEGEGNLDSIIVSRWVAGQKGLL